MSLDVSVIIPTWNRREQVCEAIASVLAQSCRPREIILVDDGSSDGTADLVRQTFPQVRLVSQPQAGVSAARNHGIRLARGEWLAFLDSDDRWAPDKLERQLAVDRIAQGCRLLHCDEIWIRHGRRVNPKQRHRKRGGWIYAHCLPLCVISPSAAVIHRSLFEDIGHFDESLPACEDYDLWLRICAREPVCFVDRPLLVKTGGHPDQLSRRYPGMDRFRLQALARQLRGADLNEQDRALTSATFASKFHIYTQGAAKRGRHTDVHELRQQYADLLTPCPAASLNPAS